MTKNEEVAATEAPVADAAPAASPAASHTEEEEDIDIDIDGGYLQKKGSNPINPWNKRYFSFGTEPVSLNNLQTVHKRNERRVKAAPKAAAPAAAAPATTEVAAAPTSEVAAGKVADKETPAAAAAAPAEPPKTVQEIYEEANRDLLVNVAQANASGKGLLYYHKSDDSLSRQNVLGIINLRDVNSVEHVEKSTKNRSFKVSTKNRDYHFSAESPQKAKGWVKAIKEKSDEAKAEPDPYSNAAFQDVYKKLVAREAFDHAKNAASIISDNEINSDGEPDDIEVENGTPVVKKRKSFFGFSAVATSHEKKKADGITTEVSTEQKKDLTHVQEGDVDALKTHESENAVSHTTDAVTPPAAPEAPKSPVAKSGGFKLFGKKPVKEEPAPPPAPAPHPLTVDEAKAQALKAVDDAVAASKAKEEEAKKETPPAPPTPEKKPGFFAGLFGKKPAPAPVPPPVANEETVVISSEKTLSDVVTAEGEVTSQSSGGFFSKVTKGKDKNEVEVKSGEVSSEDVITAEKVTHEQHIEGTDASIAIADGEQRVDLSTTDETLSTEDKIERKPSLLKRLSGVVRATLAATEEVKVEETVEETIDEEAVTAEETTMTTETEAAVEETKVAATVEVAA
ncbi:hypothetical protein K457DRAFT_153810 [Linnemannia elongata AG-77]|uniref:PH domain-containing protein n=1 Tax=Linnemannia elongata AG-77 TaxID=1314771 RepID=A0A197K435_9FUNG|nr:hypothetical protein K457DRAFT_153810 [Linnemannia elongata AG-77]